MVPPASRGIPRVPRYSGSGATAPGIASRTGLSPAPAGLPRPFRSLAHGPRENPAPALQPRPAEAARFGLLRVRSPLLAESRLISLPAGTQMVHSPAYGFPQPMCSAAGRTPSGVPVTRFGRPRITATLQLPAAYRSLPRPSSPGGSKASSTDPPLLDHIILPALSLFFQTSFHWRQGGSNPRPSACKADALASWAMPPHSPRDRGKGEELPSGRRPPTTGRQSLRPRAVSAGPLPFFPERR